MHINWIYIYILLRGYITCFESNGLFEHIWTLVQGFPLKSPFRHKQTGCDFAVWMSFNRWGYFSWMMKWHPTWKFGMQLSAAVLIAARGSMLSISLKKFLVLSYDLVFKKTTQNPLDSDEYYEHLIWTICVLFLRTSIFVGLKVPFVWGTFRDMYLHRWWRRWWMDESMIEWRNDWMHEWMNEWMNELLYAT